MKTTYDELRSSTDPVGEIVDYYKSQLCDGESLWWTGKITKDEQTEAAPMKIRLWRTLSTDEKRKLVTTGLVLFPDMLSETSTRYERFSLWLVAKHGVVSTSLRDSFSAGGQDTLITENDVFDNIPRKIMNVYKNAGDICRLIYDTDETILSETWRVRKIDADRIGQWINLVARIYSHPNYCIRTILNAIFRRKYL